MYLILSSNPLPSNFVHILVFLDPPPPKKRNLIKFNWIVQTELKPNKRKKNKISCSPPETTKKQNKSSNQTNKKKPLRKLILFSALHLNFSEMLIYWVHALNKAVLCSSSEHYHMVSATALVPKHRVLQIPHWTAGMISHLGKSFSDFKGLLCTISLTGGMAWINTITMNLVSWAPEGLVLQKLNFQQTTHCIPNTHKAM